MTKNVRTAEADWSLEELKSFLIIHDISGAPVIDDGKLAGVVSATDLLRGQGNEQVPAQDGYFSTTLDRRLDASELRNMSLEGGSGQTVRDVMTPVVFQVTENTPIDEVADMMARGRIHRVVVSSGGQLSGIVSSLDLVGVLRDVLRSA
jgi:CBS domain-containing protein